MKLLTKEIESMIPRLYATEDIPLKEKIAVTKFFSPYSDWLWFPVEGERQGDDFLFFGLVMGFEEEWGYFTLKELEELTLHGAVPIIERDLYFKPTPIRDVLKEYSRYGDDY